jgi:hypothetical protein
MRNTARCRQEGRKEGRTEDKQDRDQVEISDTYCASVQSYCTLISTRCNTHARHSPTLATVYDHLSNTYKVDMRGWHMGHTAADMPYASQSPKPPSALAHMRSPTVIITISSISDGRPKPQHDVTTMLESNTVYFQGPELTQSLTHSNQFPIRGDFRTI